MNYALTSQYINGIKIINLHEATYIRNDCNKVYYVHDIFQEGNFTRTSAKADSKFKREPYLKGIAI